MEYLPQQHLNPRQVLDQRAQQARLLHSHKEQIRSLTSLMALYQYADKNKVSRQLALSIWTGSDA